MGSIINNRTITVKRLLDLPSPTLLCVERNDYEKAIIANNGQVVSLNSLLAKAVSGKTGKEVATNITTTVIGLLPSKTTIYLVDYEMLFDPRYNLDVMKLFCEASRHCKLFVKWCGSFVDDSIIYGEPGYADYAKYKVSAYNIACII